ACASARGGCRDSRPTPTATSCSRWTGSSAATVPSSPIPRGTCCGCGGGDPAAQRVVAPAPRVDSPGANAPTTRCGTYGASSAAISSAVSSRSSAPSAPSMCEDTCCSAPLELASRKVEQFVEELCGRSAGQLHLRKVLPPGPAASDAPSPRVLRAPAVPAVPGLSAPRVP